MPASFISSVLRTACPVISQLKNIPCKVETQPFESTKCTISKGLSIYHPFHWSVETTQSLISETPVYWTLAKCQEEFLNITLYSEKYTPLMKPRLFCRDRFFKKKKNSIQLMTESGLLCLQYKAHIQPLIE